MPKALVRIHRQMHGITITINAEDVQEKGEEAKMAANNHRRQHPHCPQFVLGICIDVHLGIGMADKVEDKME